jgi:uncharacterized lipoprotein
MKHNISIILIAILVLILSACSQPEPTETPPIDDSWDKVQQLGVLRVSHPTASQAIEYLQQNGLLEEITGRS